MVYGEAYRCRGRRLDFAFIFFFFSQFIDLTLVMSACQNSKGKTLPSRLAETIGLPILKWLNPARGQRPQDGNPHLPHHPGDVVTNSKGILSSPSQEDAMAEESQRSSAAEIAVTSNGDLDQSPEDVFCRVRPRTTTAAMTAKRQP